MRIGSASRDDLHPCRCRKLHEIHAHRPCSAGNQHAVVFPRHRPPLPQGGGFARARIRPSKVNELDKYDENWEKIEEIMPLVASGHKAKEEFIAHASR